MLAARSLMATMHPVLHVGYTQLSGQRHTECHVADAGARCMRGCHLSPV